MSRCGVADVLCLGNDDVIDAGVQLRGKASITSSLPVIPGVQLRGKAWPGMIIYFFPGTLVSFENCNLCACVCFAVRCVLCPNSVGV